MTLRFRDVLYGEIQLPDWLEPFLRLPEFARLRGVRLSNVDSWQFKDFGGPTRWEHCVSVAFLAVTCARQAKMTPRDAAHLILAALLHDVATPPFAHTLEYVLPAFDHELESNTLLKGTAGDDTDAETPVFAGQLPRFRETCISAEKTLGFQIDADEVARMVVGHGEFGFLIHGSIDLDNADNVIRACLHLGINVDKQLPIRIADWLGKQKSAPVDISKIGAPDVEEWVKYRDTLYSTFYRSTDEEIGRQAFLQHLIRRALAAGMPRRALIWNTDERLLAAIENLESKADYPNMIGEVVQRYRLLESPHLVFKFEIESTEVWKSLSSPSALNWLESQFSTSTLEAMVFAAKKRYSGKGPVDGLFPTKGTIYLFKLGTGVSSDQLPEWLKCGRAESEFSRTSAWWRYLHSRAEEKFREWAQLCPWQELGEKRITNIKSHLDSIGNWDFRQVKNDTLHPYPATYVHAIPAALITALELQGQIIIDPFGGTGQTAMEAVKKGCRVVTADTNSIACLATKARLQYLTPATRARISELSRDAILEKAPARIPHFELQDKWFHKQTLGQLLQILSYCNSRKDPHGRDFLLASFSAILMQCTARRGKQHAYFADNTPLSKDEREPPLIDAIDLFLQRTSLNIRRISSFYSGLERSGVDPETALRLATIKQLDATDASPSKYGIKAETASAIITSPPYLCMADYALGNRLSYYFLFPELLSADFEKELGARRRRPRNGYNGVADGYVEGIRKFANLAASLLKKSGFLVTVVGAPTGQAFQHLDLLGDFQKIILDSGFEMFWTRWRPINWHRNQNFSKLQKERIFIFRKV